MQKIVFYPVGNGDTSQIILENGRRMLLDYRHLKKTENGDGPEINLKDQLKEELSTANRDYFDVVAFTHADKDHIENSTEFFELEHAEKYKGDDRIKIRELWVPAAMILESATNNGQERPEFTILRQEARYRLKEGKGIRVFSKPEKLKNWLESEGLTVESRRHLITDAGQIVPGFTMANDGMELFCHSPFIKHTDEGDIMRNEASLIFQVRFNTGGRRYFNYMAIGDSKWDVLEEIVNISKSHGNTDRLEWDLFNIPHHCSYLSLNEDKGDKITEPTPLVRELLLQGQTGAYMVSSSDPISDTRSAYEQTQPPHIQARKCYEKYLREVIGRKLLVTMEEPNTAKPKPLEFEINKHGCKLVTQATTGVGIATSITPPRAG